MAGPERVDEAKQAREVAAYVATLAHELKELVQPYPLRSLSYLLDLVQMEAELQARAQDANRRFD
jgi:hypothetical protein